MPAVQDLKVGIVVVSWEASDLTRDCVASLRALALADVNLSISLRIVVVDDASSSAVRAELGDQLESLGDSRVTLVANTERSGYGASANHGLEALADFEPDYIWILNNDLEAETASLLALVRAARQRPEVRIWGSTLVTARDPDLLECAGGYRYSPLTTRNMACHTGRRRGELTSLAPEPMDYVAGAAMFLPWQEINAVHGLSERYFLYFEELDLVQRMGEPCSLAWCPESIIRHAGAGTTAQQGRRRSVLQQYYENLSTLRFTATYFRAYLPLVFLARLLLKPALFLLRGEWYLYRPFAFAIADFLSGRKARVFDA